MLQTHIWIWDQTNFIGWDFTSCVFPTVIYLLYIVFNSEVENFQLRNVISCSLTLYNLQNTIMYFFILLFPWNFNSVLYIKLIHTKSNCYIRKFSCRNFMLISMNYFKFLKPKKPLQYLVTPSCAMLTVLYNSEYFQMYKIYQNVFCQDYFPLIFKTMCICLQKEFYP